MPGENRTSIPCDASVRDELKALKDERGQDWDSLLRDLANQTDSTANNSNKFTYEDAKQACRDALQEELPEQAFR